MTKYRYKLWSNQKTKQDANRYANYLRKRGYSAYIKSTKRKNRPKYAVYGKLKPLKR